MKWIAFFSQTGSEIVELSKSIGRKPDLLVTNNVDGLIEFNQSLKIPLSYDDTCGPMGR